MNYRHAFHAGNFADVHKHVVLLALLARLKRKPKPLFYLDTHAGRGGYDLRGTEALRGGEWRTGIARLSGLSTTNDDVRQYLSLVSSMNAGSAEPGEALHTPQRADLPAVPPVERRGSHSGGRFRVAPVQKLPAEALHVPQRADLSTMPPVERRGSHSDGRFTGAPVQSLPSYYPGSPLLALHALRDGDRAVLVEQQAAEAQALEAAVRRHRRVSVICGDGYAALEAYLPPRENRGLVLIDPPYEAGREFAAAQHALQTGLTRWPNGVFALWYPIKAGADVRRLHAALKQSGLRKLLALELTIRPSDSPLGLNGSGLVIANPPWQFDIEISAALAQVHTALAATGGSHTTWLTPE